MTAFGVPRRDSARLITRQGNDFTKRFPSAIKALHALKVEACLIEGEAIVIQQGFIQRTPRGRMLTGLAFQHMGRVVPQGFVGMQQSLFEEPEE